MTAPARTPVTGRVSSAVALTTAPSTEITRPLDLGEMTDKDFERAVQIMDTRKKRIARILDNLLIEGKHFGNPEVNGRKAFQKPILFQSGAEELRSTFGWHLVEIAEPAIVETPEFVSVRVRLGVVDRNGQVLASRAGSCTSKEKRFKRRDGKGFTYDDAREVVHDCLSMAEKRAGNLATRAAAGLTGYLGAEDSDDDEDRERAEDERPLTPWTEPEKARVYDAARTKGLRKGHLKDLILATLGSAEVGTGGDVEKLLAAIAEWSMVPANEAPKGDETPIDAAPQSSLGLDEGERKPVNAVAGGL